MFLNVEIVVTEFLSSLCLPNSYAEVKSFVIFF